MRTGVIILSAFFMSQAIASAKSTRKLASHDEVAPRVVRAETKGLASLTLFSCSAASNSELPAGYRQRAILAASKADAVARFLDKINANISEDDGTVAADVDYNGKSYARIFSSVDCEPKISFK